MNNRKAPANPAAALLDFGWRYHSDAAVRARVARGDTSDLDRAAANIPEEAELRIAEQTADTFYFPLPPAPNQALSDAALETAAGGRRRLARRTPAVRRDGPLHAGRVPLQVTPAA